MLHVRTAHGTFLVVNETGLAHDVDIDSAPRSSSVLRRLTETGRIDDVEVIKLEETCFALRKDGYYGCAEPQPAAIYFNRKSIGPWETFFCFEDDKPKQIAGRRFELIPNVQSTRFDVFYSRDCEEHLAKPAVGAADAVWYADNSLYYFPIKSGIFNFTTIIGRARNKILSTKYLSHSVIFDRTGFMNNHGFLYFGRDKYKSMSIDFIDNSIRCDFDEIISSAPLLRGGHLLPFDGTSFNYYHFVIEGLSHLLLMRKLGLRQPPILCLDGDLRPWQEEYLDLLGEKAVVLIDGTEHEFVNAEELYYMKVVGLSVLSKEIIKELSKTIMRSVGSLYTKNKRRRLYVKRKAGNRTVTNQDELVVVLERYGFECIDLEGLSVRTQVGLFAGADVVVGPHGAGLANIIYCRAGALLIELIPGVGEVRNFFWLLSTKVDLRYAFVRCDATAGYDGDLTVDISEMEAALDANGIS